MMNQAQIEAAIPHRPPMLLVDEVVERDEHRIVARKTFREDEFFFQGHYPNQPIVPGVILCEASMQAGAILLAQHMPSDGSGVPVTTRLNNVKFRRVIRPGETIEMEVELVERLADAFFMQAKVTCEGKWPCGSISLAPWRRRRRDRVRLNFTLMHSLLAAYSPSEGGMRTFKSASRWVVSRRFTASELQYSPDRATVASGMLAVALLRASFVVRLACPWGPTPMRPIACCPLSTDI